MFAYPKTDTLTSTKSEKDRIKDELANIEKMLQDLNLQLTSQSSLATGMPKTLFAGTNPVMRSIKDNQDKKAQLATQLAKIMDQDYIVDVSADLKSYPPQHSSEKLLPGDVLPVGDLHGNVLKLIYILVRHQLIHMDPATYQQIVDIYNTPTPSPKSSDTEINEYKTKMHNFIQIICDCVRGSDPNLVGKIILMGDLLGDRGQNDSYTWVLLHYLLSTKDANGEGFIKTIVASNHDNVALLKLLRDIDYYPDPQNIIFKNSLVNLETCISMGIIDKQFVIKFIEEDYLPNLKLIPYAEYKDDIGNSHIDIFTHAPTYVLANLKKIENLYRITMPLDGTKETLFQLMDNVNEKFISESKGIILSDWNPLSNFVWNRGLTGSPYTEQIVDTTFLPEKLADGSFMHYHHGHDKYVDNGMLPQSYQNLTKKEFFENHASKSTFSYMTGYDNNFGWNPTCFTGIYFTKILRGRIFYLDHKYTQAPGIPSLK